MCNDANGQGRLWRGQRDGAISSLWHRELAHREHLPQGHSHEATAMRPVNVRLALDSFPPYAPQPQRKSAKDFGPVESLTLSKYTSDRKNELFLKLSPLPMGSVGNLLLVFHSGYSS